jgi:hypothetical protein
MRILFDFKRVVMRGSSSRGKAVRCCQVLQRVNLSSNIIQRSLLTMALREPQEGGAALDAGRILPRSQILLRNGLCVAGRPEDNPLRKLHQMPMLSTIYLKKYVRLCSRPKENQLLKLLGLVTRSEVVPCGNLCGVFWFEDGKSTANEVKTACNDD